MKMQINPYLSFNGQCEAAFKFYEQCLGGKGLSFHKYGGSPMASQVPADWHDKVMHATLLVGDAAIMGADAPPSHFTAPQGFSVSIGIDSPADAERIFAVMSKGGQIRMPIQQTFWAARFGMFIDQFGIPWMINCEQPQG
jgi:PhnB protein